MHVSKKIFYTGIIAYSLALLWMWDFWAGINSTGGTSYAFFGKMVVDIGFICAALIMLVGPSMFASDDDEDDIGIHQEDLHMSGSSLFGLFTLNLVANGGYHVYLYGTTLGAESAYYVLWALAEVFGVFFCAMLWSHAVKAQKKLARKAKAAASGSTPIRKAS